MFMLDNTKKEVGWIAEFTGLDTLGDPMAKFDD